MVGRVMGITVRISVLAVPGGYLFPETTAAVPLRPAPPAGPAVLRNNSIQASRCSLFQPVFMVQATEDGPTPNHLACW